MEKSRCVGRIILLVLVFALCAEAQEVRRFEIFVGYSLLNAAGEQRHNFSGGQFNVKFNISPSAAFTVDGGGQYRSDPDRPPPPGLSFFNFHDRYLHAYELLVGPEFTRRNTGYDIFGHALAGLVHGVDRTNGKNFGALGLGGGVVIHQQKLFGFRAQLDYLPNRGVGRTFHDLRLGVGVVLRKK
jgi:hypothetical protein